MQQILCFTQQRASCIYILDNKDDTRINCEREDYVPGGISKPEPHDSLSTKFTIETCKKESNKSYDNRNTRDKREILQRRERKVHRLDT